METEFHKDTTPEQVCERFFAQLQFLQTHEYIHDVRSGAVRTEAGQHKVWRRACAADCCRKLWVGYWVTAALSSRKLVPEQLIRALKGVVDKQNTTFEGADSVLSLFGASFVRLYELRFTHKPS